LRISLAQKYRLLFGLAVALIIGAALAVPWYYMETMVLMQPYREAQSLAAARFRELGAPAAHGASPGQGSHGGRFGLLPENTARETIFIPSEQMPETPPEDQPAPPVDPFVRQAFKALRKHPASESYYRTTWDDAGRRFHYAHAVWVTRRCLDCHNEGRGARPYRENHLAGLILVDLPAEQTEQGSLIIRVVIGVAGALAGIFAILVFYLITTKFILAPIHELRSVAVKVSEGDLAVRSAIKSGDEFEQLSENLNTMLERLRISQEELKRANRLLDEKLEQMAEANVALYEANKVKSEFLANVSHELRTPLTSIIGFAELLRETPMGDGDPRTLRYAENILISGRILLEIINDLLDLAKIEAGKTELRVETFAVAGLCATLVDHVRPLADRKTLQIILDMPDNLPPLNTDAGKLRQILFNLMSNALKFTPEGGRIWLRGRRCAEDWVELSVQDTGPGIAPEHQQLIFDKFRQIDQSATREHHGTGLGLAIARELAMLLGGEISLESELGKGATFTIRLPVNAPTEVRDRSRPSLV
jgi:two-component system, NarL family, sensor histidine kinase BarA